MPNDSETHVNKMVHFSWSWSNCRLVCEVKQGDGSMAPQAL